MPTSFQGGYTVHPIVDGEVTPYSPIFTCAKCARFGIATRVRPRGLVGLDLCTPCFTKARQELETIRECKELITKIRRLKRDRENNRRLARQLVSNH